MKALPLLQQLRAFILLHLQPSLVAALPLATQ
jgi:hypothetical protein